MQEITVNQVSETLLAIVAEHDEEYGYKDRCAEFGVEWDPAEHTGAGSNGTSRCQNVHINTAGDVLPGCIVGEALIRLVDGVTPEWILMQGMEGAASGVLIHKIAQVKGVTFETGTQSMLGFAQSWQDRGYSWARAVNEATQQR